MTTDVRPEPAPAPAAPPRAGGRQRNMIMVWIGLSTVYRLLRDHRFHISVVTIVIAVVAISRAAQENNSRNMERLVAWTKKQDQRLEHKVKEALPR